MSETERRAQARMLAESALLAEILASHEAEAVDACLYAATDDARRDAAADARAARNLRGAIVRILEAAQASPRPPVV